MLPTNLFYICGFHRLIMAYVLPLFIIIIKLERIIHINEGMGIGGLNIGKLFLTLSTFKRFLLGSGNICASNVNQTFVLDDANSIRGMNVSAHQPWFIFLCIPEYVCSSNIIFPQILLLLVCMQCFNIAGKLLNDFFDKENIKPITISEDIDLVKS